MFKKTSGIKLRGLSSRPSSADLQNFLMAAAREAEVQVNYCWKNSRGDQWMLTVRQSAQGTIECRMFAGAGPDAKQLWVADTPDVPRLFTAIVRSVGEDLNVAMAADLATTGGVATGEMPALTHLSPASASLRQDLRKTDEIFPAHNKGDAFNGDLALVHITNLLQSISLSQMSGRLQIQTGNELVDIFFDNGEPVHAKNSRTTGLECLMQTFCLKDGRFQFEPNLKTDQHEIAIPLRSIMMQGALFLDNMEFLKAAGLADDSVLVRKNPALTPEEFQVAMQNSGLVDRQSAWSLLQAVDDRTPIKTMVANSPQTQWVPIVTDLIRNDLVTISQTKVRTGPVFFGTKTYDRKLVESVVSALTRQETGMLTYAALVYFLERELRAADRPMVLAVFDVEQRIAGGLLGNRPQALPPPLMLLLSNLLLPAMQERDFLAHFEGNSFALLLSNANVAGATVLCQRLAKLIQTNAEFAQRNCQCMFGLAGAPEDIADPSGLMAAAEAALQYAKAKGATVVHCRDIV